MKIRTAGCKITVKTWNICIQKCPVDAIYPVTKILPDSGSAFIGHTRCALPFSNGNGCTLWIKHCPFSVMEYDRLKASFQQQALPEAT
jgi:Na+-translocating ferredoxin:NAD+ oxidoreductase RNF subunit RnfB